MRADFGVINAILKEHGTSGISISALGGVGVNGGPVAASDFCCGRASNTAPMTPDTYLEAASLSKTIATAIMYEYFAKKLISVDTSVNRAFQYAGSAYRLKAAEGCPEAWAGQVKIKQLVDHTGLGMHYVKGVPRTRSLPPVLDLIEGRHAEDLGYPELLVEKEPGTKFGYSGGGFIMLQHLLESLEGKGIEDMARPFLDAFGMRSFSFNQEDQGGSQYACGYYDSGEMVPGGRYQFPPLAAGGLGTTRSIANFFGHLIRAYHGINGPISQPTAKAMFDSAVDKGSISFMNALMGSGVFVLQAGPNRVAVHQAANEGFRGIFLAVFDGPDAGHGFVIIANGDNQSAVAIAKVIQHLLIEAKWQGVDAALLESRKDFDFSDIKQEEIVNYAYKSLVFDAFLPLSKL